ncbi:cupin domain-containing protein [Nodosilinea nodulosa]|uniref:cupin domain-containing protein n=1 Tax=Nodosilinea nodulosa TaxID=416001 RepID=UPI0002EDA83A|nr:cupin [Nodosilinea nodulosa]
MPEQAFIQTHSGQWLTLEQFPGVQILPLAEPVPEGSIHLLKLKAGTTIPLHTHPCDEYVYVLSGVVETGGVTCPAETFWITPAHTQQGVHRAVTDAEIITIRLGKMGIFDSAAEG